jgi:hypothetical protein
LREFRLTTIGASMRESLFAHGTISFLLKRWRVRRGNGDEPIIKFSTTPRVPVPWTATGSVALSPGPSLLDEWNCNPSAEGGSRPRRHTAVGRWRRSERETNNPRSPFYFQEIGMSLRTTGSEPRAWLARTTHKQRANGHLRRAADEFLHVKSLALNK